MKEEVEAQNADYPADYGKYLEECFDQQLGRPVKSYEDWKRDKEDSQ